jgi:hypothetical protein
VISSTSRFRDKVERSSKSGCAMGVKESRPSRSAGGSAASAPRRSYFHHVCGPVDATADRQPSIERTTDDPGIAEQRAEDHLELRRIR